MTAVLFFSRNGENFVNGEIIDLRLGNTEIVANKIAFETGGVLGKLLPLTDYSIKYQETVQRAEKEKTDQKKVDYVKLPIDLSEHATIFLGYPNWWGTFPGVIGSFLKDNDLSGKRLYPFCTHEGSGLGTSIADLKKLCPNAHVMSGLPVRGSKVEQSEAAIKNWLKEYNSK